MFDDIDNCASCGEDHIEVSVTELAVPVSIDGTDYNSMYYCPKTGDSIYYNKE